MFSNLNRSIDSALLRVDSDAGNFISNGTILAFPSLLKPFILEVFRDYLINDVNSDYHRHFQVESGQDRHSGVSSFPDTHVALDQAKINRNGGEVIEEQLITALKNKIEKEEGKLLHSMAHSIQDLLARYQSADFRLQTPDNKSKRLRLENKCDFLEKTTRERRIALGDQPGNIQWISEHFKHFNDFVLDVLKVSVEQIFLPFALAPSNNSLSSSYVDIRTLDWGAIAITSDLDERTANLMLGFLKDYHSRNPRAYISRAPTNGLYIDMERASRDSKMLTEKFQKALLEQLGTIAFIENESCQRQLLMITRNDASREAYATAEEVQKSVSNALIDTGQKAEQLKFMRIPFSDVVGKLKLDDILHAIIEAKKIIFRLKNQMMLEKEAEKQRQEIQGSILASEQRLKDLTTSSPNVAFFNSQIAPEIHAIFAKAFYPFRQNIVLRDLFGEKIINIRFSSLELLKQAKHFFDDCRVYPTGYPDDGKTLLVDYSKIEEKNQQNETFSNYVEQQENSFLPPPLYKEIENSVAYAKKILQQLYDEGNHIELVQILFQKAPTYLIGVSNWQTLSLEERDKMIRTVYDYANRVLIFYNECKGNSALKNQLVPSVQTPSAQPPSFFSPGMTTASSSTNTQTRNAFFPAPEMPIASAPPPSFVSPSIATASSSTNTQITNSLFPTPAMPVTEEESVIFGFSERLIKATKPHWQTQELWLQNKRSDFIIRCDQIASTLGSPLSNKKFLIRESVQKDSLCLYTPPNHFGENCSQVRIALIKQDPSHHDESAKWKIIRSKVEEASYRAQNLFVRISSLSKTPEQKQYYIYQLCTLLLENGVDTSNGLILPSEVLRPEDRDAGMTTSSTYATITATRLTLAQNHSQPSAPPPPGQ